MPQPHARNCNLDSRRTQRLLCLVVFSLLLVPRLGAAQPGDGSPTQVEVMLVGEVGRDPDFGRRVTSWFDVQRFRLRVHPVAEIDAAGILSPEPNETVQIWVLVPSPQRARVYFATASGSREQPSYLLRDLALEQGLDELGAERIAQVLYLSTVALVDGQAASRREDIEQMLKQEAPAPAASSSAKPVSSASVERAPRPTATESVATRREPDSRADQRLRVKVGVGYGASVRGDEGIWHGPRASLAAQFSSGFGLQALLQSALPTKREMQDLELQFVGGMLGILASFRHEIAAGVRLEWSAGPGLEIVHYRPVRSLSSEVNTGLSDTEARPAAVIGASCVFRESAPNIVATAQGVASLLDSHYDIVDSADRVTVGRSWPLVPSFGLEARF